MLQKHTSVHPGGVGQPLQSAVGALPVGKPALRIASFQSARGWDEAGVHLTADDTDDTDGAGWLYPRNPRDPRLSILPDVTRPTSSSDDLLAVNVSPFKRIDRPHNRSLNPAMNLIVRAGLAMLMVALLAGCARNFNIITSSGRVISAKGKPKYDEANSVFVFKDLKGVERRIPAGSVRQIAPASEKSSPTSFNPSGAK